jgi:hypothetical protein
MTPAEKRQAAARLLQEAAAEEAASRLRQAEQAARDGLETMEILESTRNHGQAIRLAEWLIEGLHNCSFLRIGSSEDETTASWGEPPQLAFQVAQAVGGDFSFRWYTQKLDGHCLGTMGCEWSDYRWVDLPSGKAGSERGSG